MSGPTPKIETSEGGNLPADLILDYFRLGQRNKQWEQWLQAIARDTVGRESRSKGDGMGRDVPSHSEIRALPSHPRPVHREIRALPSHLRPVPPLEQLVPSQARCERSYSVPCALWAQDFPSEMLYNVPQETHTNTQQRINTCNLIRSIVLSKQ